MRCLMRLKLNGKGKYVILIIVGLVFISLFDEYNITEIDTSDKCKVYTTKRFKYIKQVRRRDKQHIGKVIEFYIYNLLLNTNMTRKQVIKCVKEFTKRIKQGSR